MPKLDEGDEALKRLDERLDALATATRREPRKFGQESSAAGGYRVLGELIGGVLAGLGLGWLLDRIIPAISPWGLIVGVLVGMGVAVYALARSAGRTSNTAEARPAPKAAASFDDDDEDGPGVLGPR